MKASSPKVSIIIPTYNGVDTIKECLNSIFAQETPWRFDVHIIDSGSTDGSLNIIKQFPVYLTQIPSSEFSHGGTRNKAAANVKGEYIVFLVQDAELISSNWLITLVQAVDLNNAAGAFGGQDPRPEASMYSRWKMSQVLPNLTTPMIKRLEAPRSWNQMSPKERFEVAFFHNACSCIRRDILLKLPFRKMPYGEDMDWAKRVLLAGHTIVYEPRSRIIHSHDRSIAYEFKRAYSDHSLVWELFAWEMISSPISLLGALRWNILYSAHWVWKHPITFAEKVKAIANTWLYIGAQVLGTYLGSRSGKLMSMYPTTMDKLDRKLRKGV